MIIFPLAQALLNPLIRKWLAVALATPPAVRLRLLVSVGFRALDIHAGDVGVGELEGRCRVVQGDSAGVCGEMAWGWGGGEGFGEGFLEGFGFGVEEWAGLRVAVEH